MMVSCNSVHREGTSRYSFSLYGAACHSGTSMHFGPAGAHCRGSTPASTPVPLSCETWAVAATPRRAKKAEHPRHRMMNLRISCSLLSRLRRACQYGGVILVFHLQRVLP